jgi:Sortase domain
MTMGDRVRRGVVALSLVVAGTAGCSAGGRPSPEQVARVAPPASRSAVAGATTPSAAGPTRTTEVVDVLVGSWRRLPLSPPVRVEIPAIGVSSRLVRLGLNSRTGPAVFYRLRDLRPGDQIRVVRADRRVVRFRIDSLASYPKQSLPDEEVYGATTAPVLRLITCAGTFDRAQRSYRENLVVSATRVADGGTEAGR